MTNPLQTHADKIVGVTAAGASSAPVYTYGEFLTKNGILLLSYAEWIQVLGAIYVVILIGNMVGLWKFIRCLWRKIRG